MESTVRGDGRLPNELRPLLANPGLLSRCDGSTRFALDRTEVIAAVHGPYEPKRSRQECPDRATLDVMVVPRSRRSGPLERELEQLILRTLQHLVIASQHPRTAIQIVVQVVLDDGALLSAALNGACLALAHAGVPLRGMLAAVTFAVLPTGQALLDPTAEEECTATSVATLCYLMQRGALQADGPGQLLLSQVQGSLDRTQYEMLATAAQEAGLAVSALQRQALQRSTVSLDALSCLQDRSQDEAPLHDLWAEGKQEAVA